MEKEKNPSKIFFRIIITIILTLGLSLSLQSVLADILMPTEAPPSGNVSPPVFTEKGTGQSMTHGLIINSSGGDMYGLTVFQDAQIGTVASSSDLFVYGDLTVEGAQDCASLKTDSLGKVSCGSSSVNWSSISGIPADFSDGVDNVIDSDSDPTNEIQGVISSQGLRIDGSNNFGLLNTCSIGQILKYNGSTWNCAFDNSGLTGVSWGEVTGKPGGFSDNVDNVNDADSSVTNEIQTLSVSGRTISLSNGGGSITAPAACTWEGLQYSPCIAHCDFGCASSKLGIVCSSGVVTGLGTCCESCNGRGSCFSAGSRVLMANGKYKNIEDVVIGDKLQGENSVNTVVDYDRPIMTLKKDQRLMSINSGDFFITDNHPVMTIRGWVAYSPDNAVSEAYDILKGNISKLKIGDEIIGHEENIIVKSIEFKKKVKPEKLYNFVLDGDRTYYVNDVLVLSFVPDKNGIYHIEREH